MWFWNINGNRFNVFKRKYVEKALGIIFIYDITNRQSFLNCINHINTLPESTCILAVKMIIGNKCDDSINREVSFEEGKQLAQQLGLLFYETSAINNINIDESMSSLLQSIKDQAFSSIDPILNKQGLFFFPNVISKQETEINKCY